MNVCALKAGIHLILLEGCMVLCQPLLAQEAAVSGITIVGSDGQRAAVDQSAAVLDALIKQLTGGKAPEREAAAENIGKLGSKATPAIPHLIRALEDEDDLVQAAAQRSLSAIGPESVNQKTQSYSDKTFGLVMTLIFMEQQARPALPVLKILSNRVKDDRLQIFLRSVIKRLEDVDQPYTDLTPTRGKPHTLTPKEEDAVRRARALAQEVVKPRVTLDESLADGMFLRHERNTSRVIEEAKQLMKATPKEKVVALLALLRIAKGQNEDTSRAIEMLREALADDQRVVRLIAAAALIRVGGREANVEDLLLREARTAKHAPEVLLALGGLAEIGQPVKDKATLLLLKEHLLSADAQITTIASHLLFISGESERVALVWAAMLRDDDAAMRMNAAVNLWRMGGRANRFLLEVTEAVKRETNADVKSVLKMAILAMTDIEESDFMVR
jgi:HEAT repeat protein